MEIMDLPKHILKIIYEYQITNAHFEKFQHVLNEIKLPRCSSENGCLCDIDYDDEAYETCCPYEEMLDTLEGFDDDISDKLTLSEDY